MSLLENFRQAHADLVNPNLDDPHLTPEQREALQKRRDAFQQEREALLKRDALLTSAAEYERLHIETEVRLRERQQLLEQRDGQLLAAQIEELTAEIESLNSRKNTQMALMHEVIRRDVNNPAALLELANILNMDGILINASENIENAATLPKPKVRLETAIIRIVGVPKSQGGDLTDEQIYENIGKLETYISKMMFNLVMTAHPTNFQTADALRMEHALSQLGEEYGFDKVAVESIIDYFYEIGARLTPVKSVTLNDETTIETEVWNILTPKFKELGKNLQQAIANVTAPGAIYGAYADAFIPVFKTVQKRMDDNDILRKRTWLRSADADGRPFSTAIAEYEGIQLGLEKGDPNNEHFRNTYARVLSEVYTQHNYTGITKNAQKALIKALHAEGFELTLPKDKTVYDFIDAYNYWKNQFPNPANNVALQEALKGQGYELSAYDPKEKKKLEAPVAANFEEKFQENWTKVEQKYKLPELQTALNRDFRATMQREGFVLTPDNRGYLVYNGPALDLRQNMEINRDWLSASMAALYNEPDDLYGDFFRQACVDFVHEQKIPPHFNVDKSIYHELTREHRLAFARKIIRDDIMLFRRVDGYPEPSEGAAAFKRTSLIEKETFDFMEVYTRVFGEIKEKHGLPAHASVQDLGKFSDAQKELYSRMKKEGFRLDADGLNFSRVGDFHQTRGMFMMRKKVKGDHPRMDSYNEPIELITIPDSEQSIMVDIVRRLSIVRAMIDQYGPGIATRHQIANFSEPANFYELMIAMRETGLVTIENDRVVNAKMDIMPLLETLDDLDNAVNIYKTLLADDLFKSYIDQRGGVINIMLGFSDGGKSAGNFAAQWKIRQTVIELTKLFEEHGYTAQFFDGQGHGIVRGGTVEPGVRPVIDAPEIGATGVEDITIQSSQPNQWTTSHAKAANAVTSMAVGVLEAQKAAEEHSKLTAEQQAIAHEHDLLINHIAKISSEIFIKEVKKDDNAYKYVSFWPKNKAIASRKGRGEASQMSDWDSKRAIDTEFGFEMTQLPAHHVGLKQGLEAVIREMDEKGYIDVKDPTTQQTVRLFGIRNLDNPESKERSQGGMDTLRVLYNNHNWFRAMMDLTEIGMERTDPVLARLWGGLAQTAQKEASNIIGWVENTLSRLEGLGALVSSIAGRTPETAMDVSECSHARRQNSIIANVIMGTIIDAIGLPKEKTAPEHAKVIKVVQNPVASDYARQREPSYITEVERFSRATLH